jgi:hypothetical protein
MFRRHVTRAALAYVACIAVMATAGFGLQSPGLVLLAAVGTLPISVVALPAYYIVAGLVGLIPGANPSHASGAGYATPNGHIITTSETGAPAQWFLISLAVIGVAALTAAAMLNVLLLQTFARRRHARRLGMNG